MTKQLEGRKVFGLGLNKTGTTSLGEALNTLGIKTIHYPFKTQTYDELTSGRFRLSILENYQGIVDTPAAPYYPQLDTCYPNSKFILTLRDPEAWLRSIEAHWPVMREWGRRDPQFGRFTDFISAVVYGCIEFHRDRFLYAYETHTRNVRHYFRKRPQDLLVMDICGGDGWDVLCPFLGTDVPTTPFAHSNQGRRRHNAQEWIAIFDRAQKELANVVSSTDRVVLLDDGRVGGAIVPAGQAIAFPEKDRSHNTPVADDATAIAEIERLRGKGATHLVLTWASFWWLDYYPHFADHLWSQHRCLLRSDQVVVFDLRPS